jgi:hypothetical protein
MKKRQHIPNDYMFRLDEFLHRDTSPQGRERFTRVTIRATVTADQNPYIEVTVRSITDYQRYMRKNGYCTGYASVRAKDVEGWEYIEDAFETMLRTRVADDPSKILVRQVFNRAKKLVRSFIQGRV